MRNPSLPLAAAALCLFAATANAAPTPAEVAAAQFKIELGPAERTWLNDTERTAYESEMKRGPTDAVKTSIVTKYRAMAAKNMTQTEAKRYTNLVARGSGKAVDSYLDGLVLLTTADRAKLAGIKKGVGVGAGLRVATAQLQYDDEMRLVQKDADGRPKFGEHDHAHRIVNEYAFMIYRVEHPSHKPTQKPPQHRPTTTPGPVVVDGTSLTPKELSFLSDADQATYATASKAKHTAVEYQKIDSDARGKVAARILKDEGADASGQYQPFVAAPDKAKIDDFLTGLANLSASEVSELDKVTKAGLPPGFTLRGATAKADYDQDWRVVQTDAISHMPIDKETKHAAGIVAHYRALLKAVASKAPTVSTGTVTAPTTSTAPAAGDAAHGGVKELTDDQLPALTPAERKAYHDQFGVLTGGWQELNDKYLKKNEYALWRAKIKTVADLDKNPTTDENKKLFCHEIRAGGSATGDQAAADVLTPAASSMENCVKNGQSTGAGKDAKPANGATKADCLGGVNIDAGGKGNQTNPDPKGEFKSWCEKNVKDDAPGNLDPNKGSGKINGKGNVPSPTNTEKKDDKKGTDWDAFASNMTSGVAGGLFGLLLGSFFGPIGMVVGAAAFGAGAYALNAYANKKDDDKKK